MTLGKSGAYNKSGDFCACPEDIDSHIVWAKDLFKPSYGKTIFSSLMETRKTKGVVNENRQLKQQPGVTLEFQLPMPLTGSGVTGCNRLQGHEECPDVHSMQIRIGDLRHGVCMVNCGCWQSQKGQYIRSREVAKREILNWFSSLIFDSSFINQVSGNTASRFLDRYDNIVEMRPQYRGHNPVYAPSKHFAVKKGVLTPIANNVEGETGLSETDTMSVKVLREISAAIGNGTYMGMRPLDNDYGQYVLLLHPAQVADLKSDPDWQKNIVCADVRGKENRLFSGSLGVFDGIILKESKLMPLGIRADNSLIANTRRAVLLGADALTLAIGGFCMRDSSGSIHHVPYKIHYREEDYSHKKFLSMEVINGMAKNRFNGEDLSVMVITTAAKNFRFNDGDLKDNIRVDDRHQSTSRSQDQSKGK